MVIEKFKKDFESFGFSGEVYITRTMLLIICATILVGLFIIKDYNEITELIINSIKLFINQ